MYPLLWKVQHPPYLLGKNRYDNGDFAGDRMPFWSSHQWFFNLQQFRIRSEEFAQISFYTLGEAPLNHTYLYFYYLLKYSIFSSYQKYIDSVLLYRPLVIPKHASMILLSNHFLKRRKKNANIIIEEHDCCFITLKLLKQLELCSRGSLQLYGCDNLAKGVIPDAHHNAGPQYKEGFQKE